MKQPRVLVVTNFCSHYRVGLFELLHERFGAEFVFFSRGEEKYWQSHLGVSRGRFPATTVVGHLRVGSKFRINTGLVKELSRRDFDVLIKCINGRFELPASYAMARRKGSAFVLWTGMWMHPRSLFHMVTRPLVQALYRHADAIVTYGQHVRDFTVAEGAKAEKVFVAENATDGSLYGRTVSQQEIQVFREQHQLLGRPVVLAVSRLVPEKGLEYLIEAVGLLPAPRPNLAFVGTGPLRERLAQLAAMRGVCLQMIGGLQPAEMPLVYALADVLVMSSVTTRTFKEPWGLACNEAMYQGVPVVATTAVGAAAGGLVQDGVTGLVVPERDSQALAQAMGRLLHDRRFAWELGQRGKERVKQTNYEAMVAGFEAAVEYALRERGATV